MTRPRVPTNLWRGMASFLEGWPTRNHLGLRAELMLDAFRRRRERYHLEALRQHLRYDAHQAATRARARLRKKGITVTPCVPGAPVHTLAFVPMISWHRQLLPPLAELGPLSHYDYESNGVHYSELAKCDRRAVAALARSDAAFEAFAARAARARPVDWVFVYATGLEVSASTLARVREITSAPIVGMCLDDKQSWEGPPIGTQRTGQIDIAPELDLAWTSARVACEWYMVEGSCPIFLPEGCSPSLFHPSGRAQDIDVSFVGQGYGFRPAFVERLRRYGLAVQTFGHGWPAGSVSEDEMIRLMQRSRLILGLGGIGWSEQLKNVKGRDFDAPCVGPYVTSYTPDLTDWFAVGHEIACFSSADEAVDLIRQLLGDGARRSRLAERGRSRCLAEHTWRARFERVLETLGIRTQDSVVAPKDA